MPGAAAELWYGFLPFTVHQPSETYLINFCNPPAKGFRYRALAVLYVAQVLRWNI